MDTRHPRQEDETLKNTKSGTWDAGTAFPVSEICQKSQLTSAAPDSSIDANNDNRPMLNAREDPREELRLRRYTQCHIFLGPWQLG